MKKSYLTFSSILILCTAASLNAQTLSADKQSLNFSAQAGGAAVSQTINISMSSGSFPYTSATGATWLKVNPPTGTASTTPSALTITADPTGLLPGNYQGSFDIFGPNNPVHVLATLTVAAVAVNPTSAGK